MWNDSAKNLKRKSSWKRNVFDEQRNYSTEGGQAGYQFGLITCHFPESLLKARWNVLCVGSTRRWTARATKSTENDNELMLKVHNAINPLFTFFVERYLLRYNCKLARSLIVNRSAILTALLCTVLRIFLHWLAFISREISEWFCVCLLCTLKQDAKWARVCDVQQFLQFLQFSHGFVLCVFPTDYSK